MAPPPLSPPTPSNGRPVLFGPKSSGIEADGTTPCTQSAARTCSAEASARARDDCSISLRLSQRSPLGELLRAAAATFRPCPPNLLGSANHINVPRVSPRS